MSSSTTTTWSWPSSLRATRSGEDEACSTPISLRVQPTATESPSLSASVATEYPSGERADVMSHTRDLGVGGGGSGEGCDMAGDMAGFIRAAPGNVLACPTHARRNASPRPRQTQNGVVSPLATVLPSHVLTMALFQAIYYGTARIPECRRATPNEGLYAGARRPASFLCMRTC